MRSAASALVAVGILMRILAGADAAAPPGVTDTEVVIGTHQDLSGPIASVGLPVANGMRMAAEQINAEGGIHGRRLTLVVEDSGYDPKKAVLVTQKLLSRDHIFMMAGALGTQPVLATMPLVLERGLPHLFPLTGATQTYEPYHRLKFALLTPYPTLMRITTKWFVEQKGKKAVCVLHQDDEFGLSVKRGVDDQLESMGLKLVASTTYKRGATDFASQVAKLRAAACDLVVLGTVIRETIGIMGEARKLDWPVDMVASAAAYAPEVPTLGKATVEGLYAAGWIAIPSHDTASPAAKKWMEAYKTKFRTDANVQSIIGYTVIMLTAEGLKNAGRHLTADTLVEGLHRVKNYRDIFGTNSVGFSAETHLGLKGTFIAQVQNGRWVSLTDRLKD